MSLISKYPQLKQKLTPSTRTFTYSLHDIAQQMIHAIEAAIKNTTKYRQPDAYTLHSDRFAVTDEIMQDIYQRARVDTGR